MYYEVKKGTSMKTWQIQYTHLHSNLYCLVFSAWKGSPSSLTLIQNKLEWVCDFACNQTLLYTTKIEMS